MSEVKDHSLISQGWALHHLGMLSAQLEALLNKMTAVGAVHNRVRKGDLDPASADTHAGLEEIVELTKKFQNNASMLMAYTLIWRLDWKREHGQLPELPKKEEP